MIILLSIMLMGYEYIAAAANDDNNNGMRLIPLVLLSQNLLNQSLNMREE